ncbi:hypothetical protein [Luteimonas saliphila]|uniref:hypothetical protein n=1 Tax=Luteimonas saliphila TaxID=2804919 RepID=UPI00192E1B48|nr:hypothetical protein [Luteimonas saliphila]
MRRFRVKMLAAVSVLLPWGAVAAQEGPAELEACVVASADADDKRTLVQWMFSAIALHPDLEGMAQVSQVQRDAANKAMGALMERLLTVDCATQAKQAFREGSGDVAFQRAFGRVGEMAGEGLFVDPRVSAEAAALIRHVDMNRMVELFLP